MCTPNLVCPYGTPKTIIRIIRYRYCFLLGREGDNAGNWTKYFFERLEHGKFGSMITQRPCDIGEDLSAAREL